MYKILLTLIFILCLNPLTAQLTIFGKEKVTWKYYDLDSLLAEAKPYSNEDLVILDEYAHFILQQPGKSRLKKHMLVSINSEKGKQQISRFLLPEAFDFVDQGHYEQGGNTKIKTPYLEEFEVITFAGRHVRNKTREAIPFTKTLDRHRRLYTSGIYFEDFTWRFDLLDLRVGDVIELYYDCSFESDYRKNLFYFHASVPKVHSEYTVEYAFKNAFQGSAFSKAENIPDSLVHSITKTLPNADIHQTKKVRLHHLKSINYPKNSFSGENLPHLYVDFKVWPRELDKTTWALHKPSNFQWILYSDTVNNFQKAYTSQYAGVRKFANQLPPSGKDSANLIFLTALCDSFNNCRYVSARDLYYNESHIYDLYRGDHLLKKRVVQNEVFNVVKDIMNERRIFYYMVDGLDGRYSQHKPDYKIHSKYECNLFAIPVNKTVVFMMPRYDGVKYFLNELPYYYEGNTVALMGRNFQENGNNKSHETLRFLNTPSGNQNSNIRAETAIIKINRDSLKAELNEKLTLSGQFSTLLRHLYYKDCIDSTVPVYYFRKCTDKPGLSGINVKNISSSKVYPFKQTLSASSKLALKNRSEFSIRQWFSFPVDPKLALEAPNHDYYFDFLFTDSYYFSLDFTESTKLLNSTDFTKKINNDYFSLESEIVENSDRNYLLRVRLMVKRKVVPASENQLLVDLAQTLRTLNNFSLQLAP